MKQICRYLPILSLLLLCVPFASAQSSVDFMLGFGTAHDSANSSGLDNAALSACTPVGSTNLTTGGTCTATPSLGGFFLGFGGDAIIWKNFGIGGEVTVQPGKSQFINIPESARWTTGRHSTISTVSMSRCTPSVSRCC